MVCHMSVSVARGQRRIDGSGRCVNVKHYIMPLAVFLDSVGEGAKTPAFCVGDLAFTVVDDLCEGLCQPLDLDRRDVLTCDEYVFVISQFASPSGFSHPLSASYR